MGAIDSAENQRKKPQKEKEKEEAALDGNLTKNKRKKGKKDLNEENAIAPESEVSPRRVAEKKAKGGLNIGSVALQGEEVTGKGKKKRKRETEDIAAYVGSDLQPKKKKHKEEEPVDQQNESREPGTDPTERDKKKKKKVKGLKPSGEHSTTQPKTTNVIKKKSKGRKNQTGFPDPDEDEDHEMSSQARKALSYAFSQVYDPKRWKFNKARQNWLVRNFSSTEAIPEKYESLVVKYLSGAQGGSRDNLITTCHNIVMGGDTDTAKSQPEASKTDGKQETKGIGGALVDAPISAEPTKIAHKRRRAEMLLEVLRNPMVNNGS